MNLKFLLTFLTPASLGAALRWLLSLMAGVLIAKGWLTNEQLPEFLTAATAALLPLILSLIQKAQQEKALDAALSLPKDALPAGTKPAVVIDAAEAAAARP